MDRRELADHIYAATRGRPEFEGSDAPDGFAYPRRSILVNGQSFIFAFGQTPFNSHDAKKFIDDKARLYEAVHSVINCPETIIYNRSNPPDKQKILDAVDDENSAIKFPLIVKLNRESKSKGVFIVSNEDDLQNALENLNEIQGDSDKILVQQCIYEAKEYRAVCFRGQMMFGYNRFPFNNLRGVFGQEKRHALEDPDLVERINAMAEYLYKHHAVEYVGLDLRLDPQNTFWLLEGNSSPLGLPIVANELPNGKKIIKNLTDCLLNALEEKSKMDFTPSENQSLAKPALIA